MVSYLTNAFADMTCSPGNIPVFYSRLVLESTAPFSYMYKVIGKKLSIFLDGVQLNFPPTIIKVLDGLIEEICFAPQNTSTVEVKVICSDEIHPLVKEEAGQPFRLLVFLDRHPLKQYFSAHSIILDPAKDRGGKVLSPTGLQEEFPTLDIARRLADLLAQAEAQVSLTRIDNSFVPIPHRLHLARKLHATIFLTIATGVETFKPQSGFSLKYYYGSPEGRIFAETLETELKRKVSIPPRGLKPTNMTLLRENRTIAAAWLEAACISHRVDEGLLRDVDFRQLMAQSVFNGLKKYCHGSMGG